MEWLTFILVLGALVGVLPGVVDQYRRDRAGFWKTLRLLGVYLLYLAAVIGAMLWLMSGAQPGAARAIAGGLFGLSAIFYGGVWLARIVPRYRPLPAWFDRYPSGIDYAFCAVMAVALLVAFLN
ncbi:MAG TPA: hypothetical protein VIG38_11040 [Hyphomicrobium sp.]|jgi:hypothetical protein